MSVNRGLKNRKAFSNSTKTELYEGIKKLSEETKIPISRLLDEAIEDLLKKYRK